MRFSVIIPLYNKGLYVAKAIESVLSQTYSDYELVIMDDGSSDDSFEVASKAIEGKENCHIYRQQNAGVSMARNNAVAKSEGDSLAFLDADDWWAPTFLEEMAGLMDEYPDAGIYGTSYTIVNETKHKTRIAPIGVDPDFEKGYIDYCRVYEKTLAMPLTSISVAIPRKVFEEMQGFPKGIQLGEDFLLWIRIALKYPVAFLNKPLAFYNQDSAAEWRAVGRLHEPSAHMLWNLGFLEEEERNNSAYKQLIDKLRVTTLIPYYLSGKYTKDARTELDKVDWSAQPKRIKDLYLKPIWLLKIRRSFLRIGSLAKQWALKHRR